MMFFFVIQFSFFDVLTLMSGWMGVDSQAIQVMYYYIYIVVKAFYLGFSDTICSLIGCCIGHMDVPRAKRYFVTSMVLGYLAGGIIISLLWVFSGKLFNVFNLD